MHLFKILSTMSDVVFDLRPYVDPRTKKPQYSACGVPLLEILDWKYGIGTLAVIPPEDNYKAVTNYLQKYVTKDGKYRLLYKEILQNAESGF